VNESEARISSSEENASPKRSHQIGVTNLDQIGPFWQGL